MKRETLWLVGGLVLSAAVIGWLLNENQSLRERLIGKDGAGGPSTSDTSASGGKLASSSKGGGASTPEKRRSDAAGTNHFRGDRQRPMQETPPAGVSVVRIQNTAGSNHVTEQNVTVIEPEQPETTMVLSETSAEPILKNGGFDKELAPWICEEGTVIQDPDDKDNTLLEVGPGDSGFKLKQRFQWSSEKRELTLSFRAKIQDLAEEPYSGLDINLYDSADRLVVTTRAILKTEGGWNTGTVKLDPPQPLTARPATLVIGSERGNGKVWLDDMNLE